MALKKKNKDGYTYGFKWERYYNIKNPSEKEWMFLYNDDGIDDTMGMIYKSGSSYIANLTAHTPVTFTTLTDAKRYIEGEFGVSITKKRTVKKIATKSATKKRTVRRK